MKNFALLMFLLAAPALAQNDAVNGYCTLGASKALTSGLQSSNMQQGIIPKCTVTVYLTGTTNLATIFTNAAGSTLSNPFTSTSPSGQWLFYAATGVGYDVVMSGGVTPIVYPSPVTLTDIKVGGGGGGSSGFPFTLGSTPIASGSTTSSINGMTVNGVNLNGAGNASLFLNQAGGYTSPAGGGSPGGSPFNTQFNCAGSFCGSKATLDAAGNAQSLSNDGLKNAFLNQTTPTSGNGIANALAVSANVVVAGTDYEFTNEGEFSGNSTCVGPNWRDAIGCPPPFANDSYLIDYRPFGMGSYAYNTNMGPNGGFWRVDRWVSNQQAQTAGGGSNIFPYLTDYENSGSGINGFDGGNPDSWGYTQNNFEFMRRGIGSMYNVECQCYGIGDTHINQVNITNNRGNPDGSAEAFAVNRYDINQNLTPMWTHANTTLSAGATLIAGTLGGNVPFPGDGTYYIDATKGGSIFKITAIVAPNQPTAAGMWTVDATLTPDNIGRVAAGFTIPAKYYGATTNQTVTVTGLTSAIVTSQTVCYADHAYQESARVISPGTFSGGTQTGLVLALRYTHDVQAYVVQGSHACNFVEARANQEPGSPPGRQLFRIIGVLNSHTILYARTVAGNWDNAPGGFFYPQPIAAAGATLTRNGSGVVSVATSDGNLIFSGVAVIVSGCSDSSYNGSFNSVSDTGSVFSWTNAGSAGTTTCTNAIEILSRLSSTGIREAQEFPGAEIVNTVDPVTFANNFNITVEPNTNLQVTAGDVLENHVYNDVLMSIDHVNMNFHTQNSDNISNVIRDYAFAGEIPGTIFERINFSDSPLHYQGLGNMKAINNIMYEFGGTVTPFSYMWHGLPSPATAVFQFAGCLYGCTDARSKFDLFEIPTQGGSYTETIHQDTGKMERVTGNGANTLTVREEPSDFDVIATTSGATTIFTIIPGDTNNLVGGAGGTNSTVDQTSSATTTTIHGVSGNSHEILTVAGWSIDVPATFIGTANGCASFTSGVLGSTGVACGGGSGFTLTTTGTSGAATLVGTTLNIPVYAASSVSSFSAPSASWPAWLVPTVTNPTTTPSLVVSASAIPNSALANSSITLGSTNVVLGATISSAAGFNAATASALATTPTLCSTGNAPTGILANGNATGCASITGGGGGISGQTAGWAIEAATATTATGPFPMDDAITTAAFVTIHKNVQIIGTGTANGWLLPEGTAITGVASSAALYPDSTLHRWMQNPNNIGALMIPGIATAGTAADCVKLAANGIDLVDAGAACGSGGGGAFSALTGGTNSAAAMVVGTGASLGVSGTGTINATSLNGNTFPASAGFTSGGVFYASSTSTAATSALLTNNVVMLGGGAGSAPKNSLATDSGTAFTYTGTAGFAGKYFVGTGTTAGFLFLPQGTTSAADANCTTTTICIQAPTAVTSYSITLPGAAATGFPFYTNTSGAIVETIVGTSGSGNVCLVTNCTMVTPTLGAATATSINKVTITAPTTSATLTLVTGSTLTLNGAFNTQFTGSANATFTLPGASDTLVGIGASQTLTAKTLTSPVINGATGTGGTYTGPEQAPTFKGNAIGSFTAATIAAGAAAGTSPTITCTTSHVCGPTNGTVTLTAGTATTTGALLTVTAGTAHTNLPDCTADVVLTASPFTALPYSWSYTTSVWTLNVGTAPTASTGYTISYTCLGI